MVFLFGDYVCLLFWFNIIAGLGFVAAEGFERLFYVNCLLLTRNLR